MLSSGRMRRGYSNILLVLNAVKKLVKQSLQFLQNLRANDSVLEL
ncbi:MAG: hypothetical protein CLLPBCKN_004187 [Chroococcidiopsis cubana SAG 39.79]|nr:hypothetical protein [Chroococcidiopsis cubana SAG 39.79]